VQWVRIFHMNRFRTRPNFPLLLVRCVLKGSPGAKCENEMYFDEQNNLKF